MKANKKLLISAMALGLAGLTTVGSTYAWFAMNRTVTADGMKLQATTPASLVIGSSAPVPDATTLKFTSANLTATKAAQGTETLTPVTHVDSSTSGLQYVTNSKDVDAATGLGKDSAVLTFADAVNTGESADPVYYLDYTAYVASSGGELKNQNLAVKLYTDKDLADTSVDNSMLRAASVDFYVLSSTDTSVKTAFASSNYVGTMNLKDATKDGTTGSTTLNKFTTSTMTKDGIAVNYIYSGNIAKSTDGWLVVTMRFYFDGALKDSDKTTYVRNNIVNTAPISLGVQFTASDISTGN